MQKSALVTLVKPGYGMVLRLLYATVLIAIIVMMLWLITMLYQVVALKDSQPHRSAMMQFQQQTHPHTQQHKQWIALSHISPSLQRAVIAAEDAAFTRHNGFDWNGIEQALQKNIRDGRISAGGSTISQQLAKNLFLSPERSLTRKIKEGVITLMMEQLLSKQRILELYLNYAEWGRGIYGAEMAARHYFGVSADRLSPWQAARLAAILPNPRYYDGRRSEWIREKTRIILARMKKVNTP